MFTHTLIVRFRDLDALNHVNNSVYLTYLEEARIGYMLARGFGRLANQERGTILARCEIDYRFPAVLADVLEIEMEVGEVRHSSFEFIYRIVRQANRRRIADATTVQVCYNYLLRTPIRVPVQWRSALALDQSVI
jgi:acyl-CoA thioester hydrolase